MVNTSVMRISSRTYCLALTNAASNALLIEPNTNDQTNYVALLNISTDACAIEMAPASANVVTPSIATTGNSGSFVVPGSMNFPLIIAAPKGPFYLKGISANTSTLYITIVQAD